MAIKIEITSNAVRITDDSLPLAQQIVLHRPANKTWYSTYHLITDPEPKIWLTDADGTSQKGSRVGKGYLIGELADSGGVLFTADTWRAFAEDNLGFKLASGSGATTPVVNNLSSLSTTSALSAKQGQILNSKIIWLSLTDSGAYANNQIIQHDGIFYKNITGTNTNVAPDTDTTNWLAIGASNDGQNYYLKKTTGSLYQPPTTTEVPNPIAGDSAVCFLGTSGIAEYFKHNGTSWVLKHVVVTSINTSDHHVVRTNDIRGVEPTFAEIGVSNDGDTAKVVLSDGTQELWTKEAGAWSLYTTIESGISQDDCNELTLGSDGLPYYRQNEGIHGNYDIAGSFGYLGETVTITPPVTTNYWSAGDTVWKDGSLWVVDHWTSMMYEFVNGVYTNNSLDFSNEFASQELAGVAWNGLHFYMVNYVTKEVYVYTEDGTLVNSWSTSLANAESRTIVVFGGHVYLGSSGATLEKFLLDGTYVGVQCTIPAGGGLMGGLTHDGTNFWVTERFSNELREFTSAGVLLNTYDTAVVDNNVTGLTYDGTNLILTGFDNRVLYKFGGTYVITDTATTGTLGTLQTVGGRIEVKGTTLNDGEYVVSAINSADEIAIANELVNETGVEACLSVLNSLLSSDGGQMLTLGSDGLPYYTAEAQTPETVTTLSSELDGSHIYTNENGAEVTVYPSFQVNANDPNRPEYGATDVTFTADASNVINGPVTWSIDDFGAEVIAASIDANTGVVTYDVSPTPLANGTVDITISAVDAGGQKVSLRNLERKIVIVERSALGFNDNFVKFDSVIAPDDFRTMTYMTNGLSTDGVGGTTDYLFNDLAKTTPTSDTANVVVIANAGSDATQDWKSRAGANPPTYDEANGKLLYNLGTGQSSYISSATPAIGDPFAIAMVYSLDSPLPNFGTLLSGGIHDAQGDNLLNAGAPGNVGAWQISRDTSTNFIFTGTGNGAVTISSDVANEIADGLDHLFVLAYDGSVLNIWIDGVQFVTNHAMVLPLRSNQFRMFENRNLGFSNGTCSAIQIMGSTWTPEQLDRMQSNLLVRYGFPLSNLAPQTAPFDLDAEFYDLVSTYEVQTYSDGTSQLYDNATGLYSEVTDAPVPGLGNLLTSTIQSFLNLVDTDEKKYLHAVSNTENNIDRIATTVGTGYGVMDIDNTKIDYTLNDGYTIDGTNNTIVVPNDGAYEITFTTASNLATTMDRIGIYVNGVRESYGRNRVVNADQTTVNLIARLTAGDLLEFGITTNDSFSDIQMTIKELA